MAAIAIVLAALTVSGAAVARASAQRSASASHRGTEHLTCIFTATRTGEGSLIAAGLFTDGGAINIFSGRPETG